MPSTEKAQQQGGTSDVKNGNGASKPRPLAMKLVEVMACVDRVAKNGTNETQRYRYAMAADVYDAVRSELAKRFVLMVPHLDSCDFSDMPTKAGGMLKLCTVKVRFDFTDAESGEVMPVVAVGQGSDSGDKSVYKAMTGATKQCLIQTFLIPTGDDPEHEPKQSKAPPPAGAEALKARMQAAAPGVVQPASGVVFPNYGKAKGQPVAGATPQDLDYYANGARRSLADPAKAKFHDAERRLLAAIDAEATRQRGAATASDEPPPLTDDDAPH